MKLPSKLAVTLALALPALASGIEIDIYWMPEAENDFTFLVGDRKVGHCSGRAPQDVNSLPATCSFDLPQGATSLTVRGRYTARYWNPKTDKISVRSVSGERTFRLRDGASITRPLLDRQLPVAERWQRAVEAERALAAAYGGIPRLALGKPVPKSALDAAEKRLGFALPAGYRELLSRVGPVALGDHSVPSPENLENAERTILQRWSYGENGTPAWLTPAVHDRLQRSVILFFEEGDGVGAQLFLAPPNGTCGNSYGTVFFHEGRLARAMGELAADRLTCQAFEEAIAGQAGRLLVAEHEVDLREATGELILAADATRPRLLLDYNFGPDGEFLVDFVSP